MRKVKHLGQIYTPENIVNDMLELLSYSDEKIIKKHIIDNSCGDGAFLTKIVKRYIDAYENKNGNLSGIEKDLSTFIHGIEIDETEYMSCIDNLNNLATSHGIKNVKWDILCADALQTKKYDNKMDYVVGNPPYVRIHNLQENFERVRDFLFSKNGMTDLFIVFYEIGFNMLNSRGKLAYITPNSFYSSIAGQEFRNHIIENEHLYSLIDLGHYQPFKSATYTTICAFDKSKKSSHFDYSKYNNNGTVSFQERILTKDAFNNGKMILAKKQEQQVLKRIQNYIPKDKGIVEAKNAFATLADTVFIQKEFPFKSKYIIDVLKAATGEWRKCIFPYDGEGKVVPLCNMEKELQEYLNKNKPLLEERSLDKKTEWFAFGRSQAIRDVKKEKIAINITIKDVNSIKLNRVKSGQGVYSGLYILTDKPFTSIEKAIKTQSFIEYISTIGKCKSGGYYTFSSNDLKQYLRYKLEEENE